MLTACRRFQNSASRARYPRESPDRRAATPAALHVKSKRGDHESITEEVNIRRARSRDQNRASLIRTDKVEISIDRFKIRTDRVQIRIDRVKSRPTGFKITIDPHQGHSEPGRIRDGTDLKTNFVANKRSREVWTPHMSALIPQVLIVGWVDPDINPHRF